MLLLVSLALLVNSMGRSSIRHMKLKKYYNLSIVESDIIINLYYIVYVPGVIFSSFIYNRFSLKTGVATGILMHTIGTFLKLMINIHLTFLVIGQSIWGLAHWFLAIAPALLAVSWFEDSKRSLSVSIGVSFSLLGISWGYWYCRLLIEKDILNLSDVK